jgi:hypothetical protein
MSQVNSSNLCWVLHSSDAPHHDHLPTQHTVHFSHAFAQPAAGINSRSARHRGGRGEGGARCLGAETQLLIHLHLFNMARTFVTHTILNRFCNLENRVCKYRLLFLPWTFQSSWQDDALHCNGFGTSNIALLNADFRFASLHRFGTWPRFVPCPYLNYTLLLFHSCKQGLS